MRIGDLAHESGVSRRLLRYYEEQGLLRPARRENGYREYSDADVTTVRHIRTMLDAGFSTVVIARLVHCVRDSEELQAPADCQTFSQEVQRERTKITMAIAQLQGSRRLLDAMSGAAPQEADDA
ncbi:MerR family transcriptional regulator [Streptomycetaceae bacterium NBC_01309]